MLRINRVIIAIAALLSLSMVAWGQEDDYAAGLSQVPYAGNLEIKVWVDKGSDATYQPGDDIRVYFRTNRDAYVILYNIDTRGNVHLLYPYEYRDRRFAEANRTYRIPDLRDDYYLRVNGPEGVERIVAIATREPFPIPDLGWNYDPDQLTNEDYYYLHQPEGEDIWDFIERLNHRLVPDYLDYELDVVTFKVKPRYTQRYYVEPSFYFSYHSYPYWYSPDLYFGAVYFDYPFHAAIYIDGIFFGYAPLYLPYFLYGRHYVTIYHQGYLIYRDYCYVRPHYRNTFYVPRDRIYKHYAHTYQKDYRVIKEKPDIFWTKVRELNTKYKYTPAIKDDFRLGQSKEKFKGQSVSQPQLSKEKQFKERFKPTTGDQLIKQEGNRDKFKGQVVSEPKMSKEKQFKERLKPSTGDGLVKLDDKKQKNTWSNKLESPEKKVRQSKEDQFRQQESSKDIQSGKSFKSESNLSPEKQLKKSKESQFRQQEEFSKGEKTFKSESNSSPEKQLKKSKESQLRQLEETHFRQSKESEYRQAEQTQIRKEAERSGSDFKPEKIEKVKSVERTPDNSNTGIKRESSSKQSVPAPPRQSGKAERSAPTGKR